MHYHPIGTAHSFNHHGGHASHSKGHFSPQMLRRDGPSVKEGHLQCRMGSLIHSWRMDFCLLHSRALYIFATEQSTHTEGDVNLIGSKLVHSDPSFPHHKDQALVFAIDEADRFGKIHRHFFEAHSQEDYALWTEALLARIEERQPKALEFTVDEECVRKFDEMKRSHAHRYIIMKLSEYQTHVLLEKAGAPSATREELGAALPKDDNRYVILDWEHVDKGGHHQREFLFFTWGPLFTIEDKYMQRRHIAQEQLGATDLKYLEIFTERALCDDDDILSEINGDDDDDDDEDMNAEPNRMPAEQDGDFVPD